jgi:hypothetical protein
MDVFVTKPAAQGGSGSPPPDPRLKPTPDYGTLGPNSDFAKSSAGSSASAASVGVSDIRPRSAGNLRLFQILAMTAGVTAALLVSGAGGPVTALGKIISAFSPKKYPAVPSGKLSVGDLDRQKPQKQAEMLLARAVSRNDGASDQIQANVESWRGKIKWNAKISELTTVGLNSSDQSVRASAIEVQLAAYGLAKTGSTVESLARQVDSSDHAQKIWALWSLGLLGNRGVETDRVVQILIARLMGSQRDADEDSRHWAIEGLALVGSSSTIAPLLEAMRNDPSALVRERAACSLAESGMLTHEQRMTAVPQLINFSDDPALDPQTHAWAFQALRDITKQRMPNDSAVWRTWHERAMASGR